MIEDFYNKTMLTQRLADVTGTNKETYATNVASFNGLIQPAEEAYNEDLNGSVGKTFIMYSEVIDLKEGDRVIDGSTTYTVIGIKTFSDQDSEHHIESLIRLEKA